ncbi:MAG TPA: selenocysteine-specific translation elongation factor [bacterium]|nr:selenocysteine-specific translation elongation factor [bacterium]HPN44705.1 selenocysteine-specific translation elongation factor [bacterium]
MKYTIIGTAGHIDHGKSALVKALTGTDPDRLVEEQERGMTIDIGFAFLNEQIALIDVPGHERFIKNMVAGVSTIDLVLFIVAADDSIMPQTREHLDILSVLQVQHGIVVITKKDLVDADLLQIVTEDIQNLVKGTVLEKAPVVAVSSLTGEGIADLRRLIEQTVLEIEPRRDRGIFWMPVDRSFTIKGFGTVVTGSVLSGQVAVGDTVELLPSQKKLKVRGLQTHGKSTNRVQLGERAALNLAAIGRDEIQRGDVLVTGDYFIPSMIMDIHIKLLASVKKTLRNKSRVRVHIGTREILARIKLLSAENLEPGQSGYAQLLLETPAVAMRHDPFVIRQYSPARTIGGGMILDANSRPQRRFNTETLQRLAGLQQQDPVDLIFSLLLTRPDGGLHHDQLTRLSGLTEENLKQLLDAPLQQNRIIRIGNKNPFYCHKLIYDRLDAAVMQLVQEFHEKEPLRPGINKAEIKSRLNLYNAQLLERILLDLINAGRLAEKNSLIKIPSHQITLTEKDEKLAAQIRRELQANAFNPPSVGELAAAIRLSEMETGRILGALFGLGDIVWLDNEIFILQTALQQAQQILVDYLKQNREITVSRYRDLLNNSRKYALAMLLYFDKTGITSRVEDVRILENPDAD